MRTGGVSAEVPQQRQLQRVMDEYHELLVVELCSGYLTRLTYTLGK